MIFKRILIIIFFAFSFYHTNAQLPNDNCSGATFIRLPSTGDTCFVGDNTTATADGYVNSCDAGATPPLPAGGNEIWYTYVASGDSNFISVVPTFGGGAMIDPSITVITGNCGAFSTLVCDNSLAGYVSFNVPVGTQVWFYVTALTSDGKAEICIHSQHTIIYAGTDCGNATRLCDKLTVTARDNAPFNSGGIQASCLVNPPLHTLWYQFTVGTTGTLEFTATPNGPQGYFWALWDITNGCSSILPVACNSIFSLGQSFGMNDTVTGCLNSSFCPSVMVSAGNTYALMVDDETLSHQGFDLQWGGTFEMSPTADFTVNNDNICSYDNALVAYSGNASINALYNWSFGGATANPLAQQSYDLTFPNPGKYIVSLQVVENSCVSSINAVQITVNPVPISTAGSDVTFCSNTGLYLMGLPPTGGYSYQWQDTVNVSSPVNAQTMVGGINLLTTPKVVTYYLITTLGVCHDTDDVNVIINPRQSPVIAPVGPRCFDNNSFSFQTLNDSVAGTTFNWSFQNATPANSTAAIPTGIHFPAPGQYVVTLSTQTAGCPVDSSSDTINVKTNPTVSFYSSISSGCPPLQVQLINTSAPLPGGTYAWNTGSGVLDTSSVDTLVIIYDLLGLYYPMLTLTSAENCSSTDTINTPILVYPYADASFFTSPTDPDDLNAVVSFTNGEPSGVCTYNFGDGDSSIDCQAIHTFPDTGLYPVQLIVTSINGCVDTTIRIIEIKKFFTVYVPNAFTPNNDGRNDRLILQGDGVEDFRFRIFNRRGQLVFNSDNISNSWSGAHLDTGKQVPEGVYWFDLRLEDSNRKKHQYNGMINVIR